MDLSIGVSYDSDLRAVEHTVKEVLARNPKVLKEPAPAYGVTELDDFSINIAVKPWVSVQDFPSAAGELYPAIIEAFREKQIEMPYPQSQIRILNFDGAPKAPLRSIPDRSVAGI